VSDYSNIFDDETTYKNLLPVCLNFCLDDVAEVRFKASRRLGKVIIQFVENPESSYYNKVIALLKSFAYSINYHYRQL
jgi:hypothetical protein